MNHVFRERLEAIIKETGSLAQDKIKDILSFSHSHAKDIQIKLINSQVIPNKNLGNLYKIRFEGLGSLLVGASPDYPTIYDKVTVQLDQGKNIYDLHEMLSFVDLHEAIQTSTAQDIERIKVGHLFRTYFPNEALPLERSHLFFAASVHDLKEEIIKQVPQMETIFHENLPNMGTQEILPGRIRYTIPGLANEAKNLGAGILTSVLTGDNGKEEMFKQTASVLKMGMLSSETRFSHGINIKGASSVSDFYLGSADSVFTQMVSKGDLEKGIKSMAWTGDVRFLYSIDLLETGSYQYMQDTFGERKPQMPHSFYGNRPGILDFVRERNREIHYTNEVMIKERIPPSKISGLVVENEQLKQELLHYFRTKKLFKKMYLAMKQSSEKGLTTFSMLAQI